mgnify:CR=1 FL=1
MTDALCTVVPAQPGLLKRAQAVAAVLSLPCLKSLPSTDGSLALVVDYDRSWLQLCGAHAPGPVAVDFSDPAMLYRRKGGQNELLGRAVGIKSKRYPQVFDATAGLGRDAFVLADLGCQVTLSERSPILAWLLDNAVSAALISQHIQVRDAAARMRVRQGDSCFFEFDEMGLDDFECRQVGGDEPRVIYLDPMFPEKKSAAAKKDLALLQRLHANTADTGEAVLDWALLQPVTRIVIKRPIKAPVLGGHKPSHSIAGKAVRFDVIVR